MFGKVLEGQEVVDKVQGMRVDGRAKPTQPITIADCGAL